MRIGAVSGLMLLLLGACASQPEDARGVGFGDYNQHLAQERAEREAALAGGQPQTVLPPARENRTDIAALAAGAIDEAEGGSPAPQQSGIGAGISDEQDFEAVAGRESIESDAERLARQKAQYVAVTPTAVPSRPSDTGPDIVAYALSTDNQVGQKLYSRGLTSASRSAKNCGKYQSADLAQLAFLDAGGPQKDRLKLDPDGDGFACAWSPNGFRNAVRG